MSCGEWWECLSASLDSALPEEERHALEGHLATCRDCQQRLRSLRALKHAVARLPSREAPPGAVRARVESLLLRARRSGGSRTVSRFAAATILIGLVWVGASFARRQDRPSPQLAEELAGDHLRSVPEAMPAEVTTSDPQEVIHFFSGRIPFNPVAPRLDGARLLGGRLCKIEGRRVQLLFYETKAKPTDATFSLFVSDQPLCGDGCREARGLSVCSRRIGGVTLLLVGKIPPDRLRLVLDEAAR